MGCTSSSDDKDDDDLFWRTDRPLPVRRNSNQSTDSVPLPAGHPQFINLECAELDEYLASLQANRPGASDEADSDSSASSAVMRRSTESPKHRSQQPVDEGVIPEVDPQSFTAYTLVYLPDGFAEDGGEFSNHRPEPAPAVDSKAN
jgi:hypothetical protein